MAQYFFNIQNHHREEDTSGVDLPGDDEARRQAIAFAAALLQDEPDFVWDGREFIVEVVDEERNPVLDVTVRAENRRS